MINHLYSTIKIFLICFLIVFSTTSVQAQDKINVLSEKAGTASYYNKKFQGRKTSSGEKLDNDRFTAAHATLPYGTMVRVTNLKNGKMVVVKVNDRFAKHRGRNAHLIDLTYSAANKIDMIRFGVARVKVEVLDLTEAEAEALSIVPPDTITFSIPAKFLPVPLAKPNTKPAVKL